LIDVQPENELLSEKLDVRVTTAMREKLEMIASRSVSQRLGEHIRCAIELYIERHERALDMAGIFAPDKNKRKYVN
jgi:hypothetical protein